MEVKKNGKMSEEEEEEEAEEQNLIHIEEDIYTIHTIHIICHNSYNTVCHCTLN